MCFDSETNTLIIVLITISVCQSELQAYLQNMIELDITANEVLYGICTLRVSITVVFYRTQYCN